MRSGKRKRKKHEKQKNRNGTTKRGKASHFIHQIATTKQQTKQGAREGKATSTTQLHSFKTHHAYAQTYLALEAIAATTDGSARAAIAAATAAGGGSGRSPSFPATDLAGLSFVQDRR